MSAPIIVESGSGSDTSVNSYISLADANTYFAAAVVHADWDAATDDLKTRLILTAVKILDSCVEFNGFKANILQPLQWPRVEARDPNQYGGAYYRRPDTYLAQYFDSTTVPKGIKDATCEMARFLLQAQNASDDRTADAPGKGIEEFEIFQGLKVKFSKADQRPIIPDALNMMLSDFGVVKSNRAGNARVSRA